MAYGMTFATRRGTQKPGEQRLNPGYVRAGKRQSKTRHDSL